MSDLAAFHPALQRSVIRHQGFFAGSRDYLVKIYLPVQCDDLEEPIPYDNLDWERDFDDYVRVHVENGKKLARKRLDMGIDDDYLTAYHPYFGISIHHSFFGGSVSFGGGTSWAEPVISRAAEWEQLHPDANSSWLQRLARGLAYCRDHGDGVLPASLRGGNGPLDMVNGVMGDALFTEVYDDPENLHRVLEICWRATLLTFEVQKRHATKIGGGHIIPGNMWMPERNIGHISVDATCMMSPVLVDIFEVPYLNKLAGQTDGMFVHTHMLGRHCYRNICQANGIRVLAPADDPNQPPLLDELDAVLESIGGTPLMVGIRRERLAQDLPKFKSRRAIFTIAADDRDDACRLLEEIDRYCPLQR